MSRTHTPSHLKNTLISHRISIFIAWRSHLLSLSQDGALLSYSGLAVLLFENCSNPAINPGDAVAFSPGKAVHRGLNVVSLQVLLVIVASVTVIVIVTAVLHNQCFRILLFYKLSVCKVDTNKAVYFSVSVIFYHSSYLSQHNRDIRDGAFFTHDIFISYSHRDAASALWVNETLLPVLMDCQTVRHVFLKEKHVCI